MTGPLKSTVPLAFGHLTGTLWLHRLQILSYCEMMKEVTFYQNGKRMSVLSSFYSNTQTLYLELNSCFKNRSALTKRFVFSKVFTYDVML